MSDQRLRELERRWRARGAPEDEAAWLRERARVGDLPRARLALAAHLGHPAAALALAGAAPPEASPAPRAPWSREVEELSRTRDPAQAARLLEALGSAAACPHQYPHVHRLFDAPLEDGGAARFHRCVGCAEALGARWVPAVQASDRAGAALGLSGLELWDWAEDERWRDAEHDPPATGPGPLDAWARGLDQGGLEGALRVAAASASAAAAALGPAHARLVEVLDLFGPGPGAVAREVVIQLEDLLDAAEERREDALFASDTAAQARATAEVSACRAALAVARARGRSDDEPWARASARFAIRAAASVVREARLRAEIARLVLPWALGPGP